MMLAAAKGSFPAVVFRTCRDLQRVRTPCRRTVLPFFHQTAVMSARGISSHAPQLGVQAQLLRPHGFQSADHKLSAKPRIMLIGWLGAQKHHLNKYAQLWQGKGYDTVSVQPPTAGIVLPSVGDAAARRYLDGLEKEVSSGSSLVFHIFSNAGFLFFGTVLRLLAACQPDGGSDSGAGTALNLSKLNSSVDGIILDSAPAFITPDIAARGLASALLRSPADTVTAKHPVSVAVARAATTPYLRLPAIQRRQHELWQRWQDSSPLAPQLYLYSSKDALIPPDQIQAFMASQAQRGVELHQHNFGDSPHVEHFRWHPALYSAALDEFMQGLARPMTL